MSLTDLKLVAEIDEELCDGCHKCLRSCNYKALLLVPGERAPMVDPWSCTGCGTCMTACSHDAIVLHPGVSS